jgi:hypothetical protein
MIGKLTLAAGLVAMGLLATPPAATAAALPQSRPAIDTDVSSMVQQVHHRRHHRFVRFHRHRFVYLSAGPSHCSIWRHRCANRWGWRTRAYYRCLWRHGC